MKLFIRHHKRRLIILNLQNNYSFRFLFFKGKPVIVEKFASYTTLMRKRREIKNTFFLIARVILVACSALFPGSLFRGVILINEFMVNNNASNMAIATK